MASSSSSAAAAAAARRRQERRCWRSGASTKPAQDASEHTSSLQFRIFLCIYTPARVSIIHTSSFRCVSLNTAGVFAVLPAAYQLSLIFITFVLRVVNHMYLRWPVQLTLQCNAEIVAHVPRRKIVLENSALERQNQLPMLHNRWVLVQH